MGGIIAAEEGLFTYNYMNNEALLQYGQMEICKWMLTRGSLMIIRIINF